MIQILTNYLTVGAILFGLGAIGFVTRRNLIIMFLSVELMVTGVAINLVGFSGFHRNLQGQSFVIFILTVAACEAGIAMALFMVLYRQKRSLDNSIWQELREPGQPPVIDEPVLEAKPEPSKPLPKLPVAGVLPEKEAQHV